MILRVVHDSFTITSAPRSVNRAGGDTASGREAQDAGGSPSRLHWASVPGAARLLGRTNGELEHDELTQLANRLAEIIVRGLGTRSQWALRTALDAADTEGIAGLAVLRVPPKNKDFIDITFTVGTVDVISRWAGE